jgi:uncharacterized LabA/DUF88 family protein
MKYMESKMTLLFNTIKSLKASQGHGKAIFENIPRITNNMIERIAEITDQYIDSLKILTYKQIDLEAHSHRNTLIIMIFTEFCSVSHESCSDIVCRFLDEQLK